MCAVYRYETVEYANILDNSLEVIKKKLSNIDENDQVKEDLMISTAIYSETGLMALMQQITDLKVFLLN